jgi:uncharacterized RDD family membrane protein YckC
MKILLFRRPLAYFIDFVIVWCVCLLPQILAYQFLDGVPFRYFSKPHHLYFWVLFTVSLPIWLYFILFEKSERQSTPGKQVMKLRVIKESGGRITAGQSFVRTAIKLLPWEITHVGLLPVYFAPQPTVGPALYLANALIVIYSMYFIFRRGAYTLHDLISKTKVTDKKIK